jgi:hypothetical protein
MDDPAKNAAGEAGEMNEQSAISGSEELRKRRSTRIVQAVPLVVTGVDALGRPFTERTSTLIINCHGCRYQSKHYVLKNMWVSLEVPHTETGKSPRVVRGRVAWIQRPRTVRQLFQVALELEAPGNAWGIAFPPEDWAGCEESAAKNVETAQAAAEMPGANASLGGTGAESSAEGQPALPPPAIGTDNVRVFPSPASTTDASLQLARQVARLVSDAKQQIHAEAREAASRAVSAQTLAAVGQWQQKLEAAREHVLDETTHAIERIREESEARSRAAAEALKTALPGWLAPQMEALAREFAERLSRESEAQRGAHAEFAAGIEESLQRHAESATESAEALRWQAEQGVRQVTEAHEQSAQALAAQRKEFEAGVLPLLQQAKDAWAGAETSARARMAEELNAAQERLRQSASNEAASAAQRAASATTAQASEAQRVASEKLVQEAGAHAAAMQENAARLFADAETHFGSLREAQQRETARMSEALANSQEASSHLDGLTRRLETMESHTLASFQSQLDDVTTLHRNELHREAGALANEWNARMRAAFEDASGRAAQGFEEHIKTTLQPHLARTDEAIHRLAGGRSLLDAALTLQQDRIRSAADESFAESLARFRETLGGVESVLQEAARSAQEQALAEMETKASEMMRRSAEEIAKSAEWYEKKAQTQIQALSDRAIEQTGSGLREQAGEVSSVFAGELDRTSRNFMGHTQTQLEEAVRESFDRARALFAEAADTTTAAFTDEIQRHAREELGGFGDELQRSSGEMRADMDTAQAQMKLLITAEQEDFLHRFRESMQGALEAGLEDAQQRVQSGLAPVLQEWEATKTVKEAELRGLAGQIGSQAVEEYRGRLENVSNSFIVATVSSLDHQSRSALAEIAAAAEKNLQDTCARVFAGLGENLRERLEKIAEGLRQQR